jgi:hypothetical protein
MLVPEIFHLFIGQLKRPYEHVLDCKHRIYVGTTPPQAPFSIYTTIIAFLNSIPFYHLPTIDSYCKDTKNRETGRGLGYPNKPIWFAIGKLQEIEMEKTFKAGKPTTHEMGWNGPSLDVKPENMLLQLLLLRS